MKFVNTLSLLVLLFGCQNSIAKTIPNDSEEVATTETLPSDSLNVEDVASQTTEQVVIDNENKSSRTIAQKVNLTPVDFSLIENSKVVATLYIDEKDSEFDGISIVADLLKSDINRVLGEKVDDEGKAIESENGLKVETDMSALSGRVIIAGTYGENGNEVINQLIANGKINVKELDGRWERYQMQVIKNPLEGVDEALVIVGSDKRGTMYGMVHISDMLNVSPWVWWGDVLPTVQSDVVLKGEECNVISKEPSVKYRGIFLNDEAPSLTTWTDRRYGGRNQYFYRQVCELLIRLKANYLWPSMWGDVFSADGKDDTLANAKLADKYGIIMGTSHHEPLYRAGKEWEYWYRNDLNYTSAEAWNLYNMPTEQGYIPEVNAEIEEFWAGGVARNKEFENICTVGMRGENDSTLPAADDPPKYADLLNYIVNTQKGILASANDTNPTQLVIYKEVEDAWYAGKLYDKDCMKNTLAMFCDDNWAYIRTLPTIEQQNTVAGLGMYYHFDYVGAPKSYTWIQNTQVSTIWEQMSVAYDYNINDVWIANVGDLKPMELNIAYFLDLAYDYEYLGTNGEDKLEEYKKNWARQQFKKSDGTGLTDEECDEAASLIDRYLDLETKRVVEHVLYNTVDTCSDMYSVDNYREALNILEECDDIMKRTEALMEKVPEDLKAAFYQLVYYPAMSVPNVLKIQIYAALNNKYAKHGLVIANEYAKLCQEAIDLDQKLFDIYNDAQPGVVESGKKWSGMISCGQNYHIGLQQWDRDSGKLPDLMTVTPEESSEMQVLVEDITNSFNRTITTGEAQLPAFNEVANETFEIKLGTKGGAYEFEAVADAEWIILSDAKNGQGENALSGSVTSEQSIYVSIDWSKIGSAVENEEDSVSDDEVVEVDADAEVQEEEDSSEEESETAAAEVLEKRSNTNGAIVIKSGDNEVVVKVEINPYDFTLETKTYVMTHGYATIDVANYSEIVDGKGTDHYGNETENKFFIVHDNGKYLTTLRTTSTTTTYKTAEDLENAPYVEYKVYVPEDGVYSLESQFNPTSNLVYGKTELRYGIVIDDGEVDIINSIVDDYLAGTWKQGTWARDIEANDRRSTKSNITLSEGVHTIRYYQCDPNLALIRMTLFSGKLAPVYGSPEESVFIN
jgi:hypothetical protein